MKETEPIVFVIDDEALIRDGIRIYIEELREESLPIPEPVTTAEQISVAA